MEFYASCPLAFEPALARELRTLGARRVRPLKGRVSFEGEPRDAYRVCLWSHLASRVHVVLGRFACATSDELYQGVFDLPWHHILRPGASLAVSAHGTNPELRNTRFSMLHAKDAIVDRLLDETGARPAVDTQAPDAHLTLAIRGDRASMSLDLSGEPLFKRLPRSVLARAPQGVDILRPDYAALLLAEAGWPELCRAAHTAHAAPPVLLDLACADGGVLLEAASWPADRAPGAARTRWGFQGWAAHDRQLWRDLLTEARERAEAAAERPGRIVATDNDDRAIEAAKRIVAAGRVPCDVTFVAPDATSVHKALGRHQTAGAIVADTSIMAPGTAARATQLITQVAALGPCHSMPIACLTSGNAALRIAGRAVQASSTLKLGTDDLQFVAFAPSPGARKGDNPQSDVAATVDVGSGKPVPVLAAESEQFARRLIKVARQRRKWAKRAGITCYRVYDADLPDYAAAIDLYEGETADHAPGRWLVIAEYAAPKTIDPERAQDRMLDILAIAPRVLDVPTEHVHAKIRQRSRGGSQYGKQQASVRHGGGQYAASPAKSPAAAHVTAGAARDNRSLNSAPAGGPAANNSGDVAIREGGLTFIVNFDDYLDTGIFLDHRVTRGLVREHARHARTFLNLFAYTGTATCYAADAGVEETVTVDLSNTYLDWAAANMRLNGFTGPEHHFVRDDVLGWVEQQLRGTNRWDLIFCDPPTFSNSSRMGARTWDVQRDHVELLRGVTGLLEPGGEAIFSCNLRSFKPDVEALAHAGIEFTDITEQTIPEDFQRNKRIHRCYLVRRA